MKHLVIIGNGITGTTIARQVRKQSDDPITLISEEYSYFFSRPALMYLFMKQIDEKMIKPYENWFWDKNRLNRIHDRVTKVDPHQKKIYLEKTSELSYDTLVIASGSKSKPFSCDGTHLPQVMSLYDIRDLPKIDKASAKAQQAIVVGGGLIGIELVEMLLYKGIKTTFLIREPYFGQRFLPQEEARLVHRHMRFHQVDIHLSTELVSIQSNSDGNVEKVILKSASSSGTDSIESIPCQFVGITIGVQPNIDFLKDSTIKTNQGILVNKFLETNIPAIYAAGDCAEIYRSPNAKEGIVEQLWYTGKMQSEALAKTLCGTKTAYHRGIPFNSAKFMDLEYQSYGTIDPMDMLDDTHPSTTKSLYWQSDQQDRCLRIVYNKDSGSIVGIHSIGIRLNQEVCMHWLTEASSIQTVLSQLHRAHFEPEWNPLYLKAIQAELHL